MTISPRRRQEIIDALRRGAVPHSSLDEREMVARTDQLMEQRLAKVTAAAPSFSAALRGYRQAHVSGETATADALLAWLAGQPNVAAAAKRSAGVKGEIDHFAGFDDPANRERWLAVRKRVRAGEMPPKAVHIDEFYPPDRVGFALRIALHYVYLCGREPRRAVSCALFG